nr:GGDEF domain-containing protein [Bordetella genomosp. 12]
MDAPARLADGLANPPAWAGFFCLRAIRPLPGLALFRAGIKCPAPFLLAELRPVCRACPFPESPPLVASVILGMLCLHLFCFCLMFKLISTRLHGRKMGLEVFAFGNLMLGCAYVLQLLGASRDWTALSFLNHTLTLCAPVAYLLGAMQFFNRPTAVYRPLLTLALLYTAAQWIVQTWWGTQARHALLAGACALLFLGMSLGALRGMKTYARDMPVEMAIFTGLIGGICVLNAIKLVMIISGGLLDMGSRFQMVFYLYMSFLGTVLPPATVWLVLRRLTDELHRLATQDPLTELLNRRGLASRLEHHFASRAAPPGQILMIDIDHFKRINDHHGHLAGDRVLSHIGRVLTATCRQTDLICRMGGEEFVIVRLGSEEADVLALAEAVRAAIAHAAIPLRLPFPTSGARRSVARRPWRCPALFMTPSRWMPPWMKPTRRSIAGKQPGAIASRWSRRKP